MDGDLSPGEILWWRDRVDFRIGTSDRVSGAGGAAGNFGRDDGVSSTVPDIAVLLWEHIEFDVNGEPIDNVVIAPDWTIEILSPEQSANRVTGNILHCLSHGCKLGWLIDPANRSILVFRSQQQPELLTGENILPVLAGVELNLTVAQVFSWLQMGG
jgi:Uma2 family endonuclease